jgi:hypothetical protein
MTWFRKIQRFWSAKISFVFNGRQFGFANFSKFFLGRNEGNQRIAGEKIWIRRFWELAASFGAGLHGWAIMEKQRNTIPSFPE